MTQPELYEPENVTCEHCDADKKADARCACQTCPECQGEGPGNYRECDDCELYYDMDEIPDDDEDC